MESALKLLQGAVALRRLHLCAEVSGRGVLTARAAAASLLCLPYRLYATSGSQGCLSCLQQLTAWLPASDLRAAGRGGGLLTWCRWMLDRMRSQHALSMTAYNNQLCCVLLYPLFSPWNEGIVLKLQHLFITLSKNFYALATQSGRYAARG